jgi:hypothetical protein
MCVAMWRLWGKKVTSMFEMIQFAVDRWEAVVSPKKRMLMGGAAYMNTTTS